VKQGPRNVALGAISCPLCHEDMRVTTNKEGYPTAYCAPCRCQLQVRAPQGSLLLLGKVHEWQGNEAIAEMVDAADARVMYQKLPALKPPKLPPHLSSTKPASSKTTTPEPEKPKDQPAKGRTFLGLPL
jgi:hypothetical protein